METNLIFACGFGFSLPEPDDFITKIQARDGKPVHWYEIEAEMAQNRVDPEDVQNCLGIQEWIDPEILDCPLSGPLIILSQQPQILEHILPFTSPNQALGFHQLRKTIWEKSDGEFWLDLQIRWEINKFTARLFSLNKRMKSQYLI